MALNLMGEPLPDGCNFGSPQPACVSPTYVGGPAKVVLRGMEVDAATAQLIQDLMGQKEVAVQAENYDEAKRLKLEIERLQGIGAKVAQLESRQVIVELARATQ